MNKIEMHLLAEEALQNKTSDLLSEEIDFNNKVDEYTWNTIIRLINIWSQYQIDENKKIDFECALRNYLLLCKKSICIPKYIPSERFEDMGLQMDKKNDEIWASLKLPNFTNNTLVKQLYMQEISDRKIDNKHNLKTNGFIRNLTGFENFKSNEQKMSVLGALRVPDGYSCLVSMTTGGGKSLIIQTVAYQKEGLSIVIVPTISLMIDQYNNAKKIVNSEVDNEIFYYHNGMDLTSFLQALKRKKAKLLFISPESLIKNSVLRNAIQKASEEKYLKNIFIDEAHIVIEWGSSFRIDFQCIDALRKNLMLENTEIRTYLLSATYSDETIRQLKLFYNEYDRWIEIRCEKLRHETRFDVVKCDNCYEKRNRVFSAIDLLPRPMIVYVKSPENAENLKRLLKHRGYNNVYTFTGHTVNEKRLDIINKWKSGMFDLMIATCAFGVGVDKKDVRTVLHTYIPENPNKYYQEAGRGGRDGLPCLSSVIYTESDVDSAFNFVSKVITTEKLIGRWFSMLQSDKTKALHESRYLIDTYVKPNYNTDEEYVDSISGRDINWNVYVILFLRRNGLIVIEDIQYFNNKYMFYIKVKDRRLLSRTSEIINHIENMRDTEWENIEKEFFLMKRNLSKVGKSCWSDMFTKVYRKTDDYCAGCNEHNDVIDFEDDRTLKLDILEPKTVCNKKILEYMYGGKCMLQIEKNCLQNVTDLVDCGADVLVGSDKFINMFASKCNKYNTKILYCNYFEFVNLISQNKYYISGSIIIVFPDDISLQNRLVNIIESNITNDGLRFIVFSDEDYEILNRSKKLSDLSFIQYYKQ